jgi:predicted dehydrogenase
VIRTAVIGTGNAARLHAAAVGEAHGELGLVAVAGRNRDAARQVAAALGPHVGVMTADEAVRDASVDAVILAVPASIQPGLAIAAFQAGKHVLCEKPLAPSLPEAEAVRTAWKAAGTVGMVNFCYRLIPQIAEFRQRLDARACGELSWLGVEWVLPSRLDPALPHTWKAEAAEGGGALRNFASHVFDYLLHGKDARVSSAWQHTMTRVRTDRAGTRRAVTADEVVTAMFEVDDWCPVVVHVSLITQPHLGHRLTARGSKGTLTTWNTSTVSPAGPFACEFSAGAVSDLKIPRADGPDAPQDLSGLFTAMAARFSRAISGGGERSPDIEAGVDAVRLADAVAAAARPGA